jgi:hypothetical protein
MKQNPVKAFPLQNGGINNRLGLYNANDRNSSPKK